jgi:hypothetical protein
MKSQSGINTPEDPDEPENDGLNNEGIDGLYWEHLEEYELTELRSLFLDKMKRVEPARIQEFEEGAVKADFEVAVQNCDNSWRFKTVKLWLDARDTGEMCSLRKRFLE